MNYAEYLHLTAEREALGLMLQRTPQAAVIDRLSTEARLKEIESQLSAEKSPPREPAVARFTFRGRPVIGTHGVFAEFGAKVMDAFSETVAVLAAAQSGPVSGMGPVPNREQNQLLITGTALGSFGFQIEEQQPPRSLFGEDTAVAAALAQTTAMIRSMSGSDDELTEAVAGLDARAIKSVRALLEVLVQNEAVCTLEYRQQSAGFQDVAQVRRGVERIAQDNIHESVQTFFGEFQGVLPKRRTFEFKVADGDQVISGKIATEIGNADELNRHLHEPVSIKLVETRIGQGRARYVLRERLAWANTAGAKEST